jgi:hypothetical protein
MGEDGGGGEYRMVPPHLNPLPPGERRYFLRNAEIQNGHPIPPYLFEIDLPSAHHFVRALEFI